MKTEISILQYSDDLKSAFYQINNEWISNMFVMEKLDLEVLSDPETHILSKGGKIWFAQHAELGIIGTCALRKTGEDEFELTKMGVLEIARGLKVGEVLLQYVINYVYENNISLCYLLTNSKCEAAIHLYLKNNFFHDQEIMDRFGRLYQRCDVAMRLRAKKQ